MPSNSVWERIRRARMVRVLLVYLGAAWGVLEVADLLQESLSLPSWVVPVAILLLLIGLVIILATAWVQAAPAVATGAGAADGGEVGEGEEASGGEDLPGPWEVDPKGLAQSLRQGRLPHLTWSRSILGGVFAFWFLFGLAGLYVVIKDRGKSFAPAEAVADVSAEGIAIVPFTVRGEDLDVWREGMVDLLSTSLDDVGGYRTIDSRTVMARWSEAVPEGETADLATTLEVAKRTGARYAINGSAVAIGDQVRLATEVYDVSSGDNMGGEQVEGPADSVLSLVNRLAVQTMQVLLREEGGEGVTARAAMSLTTASLPALKAYLEGEAYFRRADFDRAIEAYERAVADDPDLALAHFRLSDAYGWSEDIDSERGSEHLQRAAELSDRLSNRDQAILEGGIALRDGDLSAVPGVREITRRYPDDPDAWFLLSEFYFHYGDDLLLDWDEIGSVFEKPIALEPRFAPYYLHQFDYAVIQRDTATARSALENLRTLGGGASVDGAQLAYDLVLGDSATQAAARVAVREASDGVLAKSYPDLWLTAARPVAFEPVFQEMTRRRIGGSGLGNLYMMGGKADAAMEFWSGPDLPPLARVWSTLAIGGWVRPMPEEEMREVLVPGVCGPVAEGATHCLIGLGKGLADLGETDDVAAMVTELRTVVSELRAAGDEEAADNREQIADAVDAYGRARATSTGPDHAAAIADLKDLQGSNTVAEGWIKWWLGDLLLEDGDLRQAAVYYEASRHGFLNALANYRLGGIYQELGEPENARDAYVRFLQAWEEADPDLPQLDTARAALETLLDG